MIKAYYNSDLIGEGNDGRDFGIEIYKEDTDELDFEFFSSEKEALSRVMEINQLQTDDWDNISNTSKKKLSASQTAILFSTKHMPHKEYEGQVFEWSDDTQESVLKGYDNFVFTFMKIIGISQEFVFLSYINERLIDVLKIMKPERIYTVLENIQSYRYIESTGNGTAPMKLKYSPAQALFLELYGQVQALQVRDKVDGVLVDLFNYDFSYMNINEEN